MPVIRREHIRDQIYSILKKRIENFEFSAGERINVEQLSRELKVSRTPVWEAIHRLVQEGLLENVPNHGVYVTELTPEAAIELYIVRETLERLAARLAVNNINKKFIEQLYEILNKQKTAIQKGDLDAYARLDFAFHTTIYKMSGNKILYEILESIKRRCDLFPCNKDPILYSLYEDHLEIVKGLEEANPEKAVEAFNRHNRKVIAQIRESYEQKTLKEVKV